MKNWINFLCCVYLLPLLVIAMCGCETGNGKKAVPPETKVAVSNSRSFEFNYGAAISGVPANSKVRVWFPIAESNQHQSVSLTNSSTPSELQLNRDSKYGNQMGYFEIQNSDIRDVEFNLKYDATRVEAKVDGSETELSAEQKELFLAANRLVPVGGKPQELVKGHEFSEDVFATGESLYNVVEQHMSYDKSKPGYGNGDVVWACDSQTGNCTDFHSLFISLARSQKIPARFEIGFPIPTDKSEGAIGGYHCWAWFHVKGKGWSPVDISEADKHPELKDYYFGKLTADRISFSSGRDIVLSPESNSEPLNYFIYPYVEVDGQPWPKEKIKLNFSFADKH